MGHSFRVQSIMEGKARQKEFEASGHIASVVQKQKVRNARLAPFDLDQVPDTWHGATYIVLVFNLI